MISYERFSEILDEEMELLPEYVFEELNGGVLVDKKANLHPERVADDLYIMGTYSTSPIMGKQIVIYYGSFAATMGLHSEEDIRLKIRDTLRHEFRHHMETRAGFFGKGTLIDEDKQEMDRYYAMHRMKEEQQAEKERLEKERLERERLEKERLEKERLEKECSEKEGSGENGKQQVTPAAGDTGTEETAGHDLQEPEYGRVSSYPCYGMDTVIETVTVDEGETGVRNVPGSEKAEPHFTETGYRGMKSVVRNV